MERERDKMESENIKRSNWDAILPAKVRYDSRLKGEAKILYSEILLLSSQKGYCYATDKYLAESYSSSQRSINRHIASLKNLGYIKIETERKGKRVTERRIYPLELPKTAITDNEKGTAKIGNTYQGSKENFTRGIDKVGNTLVGTDKIGNRGIDKIGVVNDSNSNESNINKEIEKEGQSASDCPTPFIEFKNLHWYENELGSLDGKLKLLLDKYLTSLPVNVIQYAIDKTAKKDNLKSSYGYLKKVLEDYQTKNIQTLDDLERLNAERYKQKGIDDLNESSNGKQQPETKSISEWQKEQRLKDRKRAISQSETDNSLPEWLDPKLKAAELEEKDNQQDETKANDGQPVIIRKTPAERPKMTQDEQINVANGIAALQKGERLTKYQIKLIEQFDDRKEDLELLRAYKHQAGIKVR